MSPPLRLPPHALVPPRPRLQRQLPAEPRTISWGEFGDYLWRDCVKPAFPVYGMFLAVWMLGMIAYAFGLL